MIRIKVPRVKVPRVRLHINLPIMSFFNVILKVVLASLTVVLVVTGALGLVISYVDPTRWVSPILPIQVENFFWTGRWLNINEPLMSKVIYYFNYNMLQTIGISSGLILLGLLLHIRKFKLYWRKIRAAPMGVIHAPVRAYKRIIIWRNWVIAKIEYVNSESAKWRTAFTIVKSPYSFLRIMGLNQQTALAILALGSTAGTGVVVNETILAEKSFKNGDSGIYSAPLDAPTFYSDTENTLRIDLGSTPVREITIENVSVGTAFTGSALPSGKTTVVEVTGVTALASSTRLEVGTLIFEKSRCKTLTLSQINAHTLIVNGNASDGQSIAPSPGSARMRAIGGGHHQAEAMVTSGGTYDRIWIQAPTSGVNGKVGTLKLSNLFTKGGDCLLSHMDIGTLRVELNEIGNGNGFSTKEFVIATSTQAANMTIADNVEVSIAEPETQ
jgi:hypothetical protein